MTYLVKSCLVALSLGMLAASPASAEQWKRATRHGGDLSREVTRDGRVYSGETTRNGPNGGVYSSSSTCFDGVVDRCKRSYSATGPQGKTVSGDSYAARGPFRVRTVGVATGPNGDTLVGVRRFWRR